MPPPKRTATPSTGQLPPQPLHLVFVSSHDPLNVRAFSGTIFYMAKALQGIFPEIELVRSLRPGWFERFETIVRKATRGRKHPGTWRWLNRLCARRASRGWRGKRTVVIAAVASTTAGELAAFLPVVNISDATFALMRSFYEAVANLDEKTAARAEEAERRCIATSTHNSFSSRWAAESAISHYGAAEDDVSVISWGCNLDDVSREKILAVDLGRSECRLLFIGVDWFRKGGDVVCETAELLVNRQFPIRLDIVGSAPPEGLPAHPWLVNHGFLSKGDPAQEAMLHKLIREADFLFLPTRQDTYGIVFAEASAYGTPSVTRDVGGVADVVRHGKNGIVLPASATPEDFARAIEDIWRDRRRYAELRDKSRREYEDRLNWRSWAFSIKSVIETLMADGKI